MTDYLVHFNRLHNPKNGRFDFGDGDGDGQINDRESLRDKFDRAKNEHRSRVMENESYKVNKGSLKLKQDQIANQRNREQSDIKTRKLSLKDQKSQAALSKSQIKRQEKLEREQQKRLIQEERANRLIDKARQKSLMDLERAEARERMAQANASRNEAKRIKQEERAQQKAFNAQMRADRQAAKDERRAMKEYQRAIKQQNDMYEGYTKKSKSQAGRAFVALMTGRPITAIARGVRAVSNSNKAKRVAESSYYR